MVHLVDLLLVWYPAVLAIQCHRNFGFQKSLPLFLPLLRPHHNAFSVSKLKHYSKVWNVVIDTTFGTIY